jgi:four helix bundle protein
MSTFKDLLIWQKAMNLVTDIYKFTRLFPKDEQFGLTSQIRRSSISIPSNIAEGYGRQGKNDYLKFLHISLSSLFEMQTQIEIAKNIDYLNENNFKILYEDSRELERMLVSFINNIKDRK